MSPSKRYLLIEIKHNDEEDDDLSVSYDDNHAVECFSWDTLEEAIANYKRFRDIEENDEPTVFRLFDTGVNPGDYWTKIQLPTD